MPPPSSTSTPAQAQAPAPAPSPAAALADEDYDSAADSDFDPSTAAVAATGDDVSSSGSDGESESDVDDSSLPFGVDEASDAASKKRKRPSSPAGSKPKKEKKEKGAKGDKRERRGGRGSEKKNPYAAIDGSDGEGGAGGLVKTRRQRALEVVEKRAGGVAEGAVTTDVDRLWEEMNSAPLRKPTTAAAVAGEKMEGVKMEGKAEGEGEGGAGAGSEKATDRREEEAQEIITTATGEKMVKLKMSYEFAGQTITEEKLVPLSSTTYSTLLSSSSLPPTTTTSSSSPSTLPPRRPPPKKRTSVFDTAAAARAPPPKDTSTGKYGPRRPSAGTPAPAPKINTLEKSRLDWAGFVDKEGIADELKMWNKGEKGYLDRQAFLGRVEGRAEETRREARRGK